MRLRTLPVSLAGVVAATALAYHAGQVNVFIATLCLVFATLAQIASNFANEYFDFRDGLDHKGRQGPRRGVTEGDITPKAMLIATLSTLAAACAVGCSLLLYGPWWLLPVGMAIALGVMAYSTGPYPLSRHGLGEVAVLLFFGVIPVNLTFYLQTGYFTIETFYASLAIGLLGANVLIVNNYRDYHDDLSVSKKTLAVILGPRIMPYLYLANWLIAMILLCLIGKLSSQIIYFTAALGAIIGLILFMRMRTHADASLTPILGQTAVSMAAISVMLFF